MAQPKIRHRTWHPLASWRKAVLALVAAAQLGLAGAAWTDLARRPASQVRGPKWRLALIVAVNFTGPLAYFRRGRRRQNRAAVR